MTPESDDSRQDETHLFKAIAPGTLISHYRIVERLASGGMGVVYKAFDTRLERTVALKFLPPHLLCDVEAKHRFEREAKTASSLNHPNIATVHEIDEVGGRCFICMEFLDGVTIKALRKDRALSGREVVDIGIQVARGLKAAHKKGVIHRDIKPQNIMVTSEGIAKITDFGLAKLKDATTVTRAGTAVGTVKYMSPEQAGGRPVDQRSDIWSFGVLLYEMVTGRPPFEGDEASPVIHRILNEEPELPIEIPAGLRRVIKKALTKDPAARYQDINEVLGDLQRIRRDPTTEDLLIRSTQQAESEATPISHAFVDLVRRWVPQILGFYILASWGIVAVIKWLVDHYPISPSLPGFVVVLLVSLAPAVVILTLSRGRLRRARRLAKIWLPANAIVAIILLLTVFHGKDLGATTKTVTLTDEAGQVFERQIPKADFRIWIAFFHFENESGDSALDWLQSGIPSMLADDLLQDIYINVIYPGGTYRELREAGHDPASGVRLTLRREIADALGADRFVCGSFNRSGEILSVSAMLFDTGNGRLIAESRLEGPDAVNLADELAGEVRDALAFPRYHAETVEDLPLSEVLSTSLPAIRMAQRGGEAFVIDGDWETAAEYMEKAVHIDPSFAQVYLGLHAMYSLMGEDSKAKWAARNVMKYIDRLPERLRLNAKQAYYQSVLEDQERAFRVTEMWVELYPDDMYARLGLASQYRGRNQLDDALAEYEAILNMDPNNQMGLEAIASIYEEKGESEKAIAYYERYVDRYPDRFRPYCVIGGLYETLGHYDKARISYEKANLIDPTDPTVVVGIAAIESKTGQFDRAAQRYGEALDISRSTKDTIAVYEALMIFHELRGQLSMSTRYADLCEPLYCRAFTPLEAAERRLQFLYLYAKAGLADLALEKTAIIESELPPPLNVMTMYAYVHIHCELGDPDKTEGALEVMRTFAKAMNLDWVTARLCGVEGLISELRGDYEVAICKFEEYHEVEPMDATVFVDIGRCYRKISNLSKAKDNLLTALKVEPFNPEGNYQLALTYREMGKDDRALEHLQKALYVWEDADSTFEMARDARADLEEWQSN